MVSLDLGVSRAAKPRFSKWFRNTVSDWDGAERLGLSEVPLSSIAFNRPQKTYAEVNLDRLQHWIDTGRIDSTKPITISVLVKSGCVRSLGDGVALLAQVGTFSRHFPNPPNLLSLQGAQHFTSKNVDVRVTRASANAIRRVEELGGKIVTSSLSPAERQYHLRPERFAIPPRPSIPMDLNVVKHYISPAKRGNLELEKVGQRAVIRVKDV